MSATKPSSKPRFLDRPGTGTLILRVLIGVCALLAATDLLYDKHVHYGFEAWPGFYGAYGFIACVGLVLAAKELRKLVRRDEDYYG